MTRRAISTTGAPAAIGPYSQAIATEGLLFTAGQAALDPATGQLVEGGIEAETERVLANLTSVLDAAGCSWGDVVKTTIFLVDMADFATVNAIYGRYMSDPPPARSTVGVAALPKGARVEIEAVARLRG
ncbi:MAG: RidA family protein [Chloroflexi bacterium]|nr:RidA family protein [Chloroflexota bacterium]